MPYDSLGVWSNVASYHVNTGDTLLPSSQNPPWEDAAVNGFSNVVVRDGRAAMTGALNMGTTNKIINLANGSSAQDAVAYNQLAALTGANQGFLFGLTLSNNATDAVNDIDIAVGSAADSTSSPYNIMTLSSLLTKRLDAAWAVGSGQGGLDTGSIANTTYHVWLIQRSDTSVVDALFSTSATSPTMPTNYDRKRRIGSIIRESAAIVTFEQNGDTFRRKSQFSVYSGSTLGATLVGAGTPLGIKMQPIMIFSGSTSGTSFNLQIGDGSASGIEINILGGNAAAGALRGYVASGFFTDASARLWLAVPTVGGASVGVSTIGWIDTRGRI